MVKAGHPQKQIVVSYSVDSGTTWTVLGTLNTSEVQTLISANGTTGKKIRFRYSQAQTAWRRPASPGGSLAITTSRRGKEER